MNESRKRLPGPRPQWRGTGFVWRGEDDDDDVDDDDDDEDDYSEDNDGKTFLVLGSQA